jgi:TrpR-related protein YerC/YecD
MGKRSFTESGWRNNPSFQALCRAVASCNTEKDVANFFRDIGTLAELKAWSERFEVAKLLAEGRSYRAIAKSTGASTTTVMRVANFLENGEGGYQSFLKAHHHTSSPRGERMVSKA